ncbi:MotA/TolQ/ExbB proton channel family protein [Mesorhizobium sp. BR1-1-13]|uniref:MotA/TolQ/ExbB proton channel family protein n=1 Tax=Mesorhizobium sp. BR1-1-13 TaxID=2876656 RepID=UPI001CD0E4D1|nr:MotA/TolQ/ExbB proton channel family protein [Mesorhizobium sp. BR1-1-13]MBZ9943416.1 MotA/TolQ/ExbB proton channel family protein [Mesorhizobium sp. BR1-1-13]
MTLTKRLFIANFAGACLVVWAWFLGYVGFVYSHDISRISYVITALFAASIAAIFLGKTSHIERAEVWLVTLGLIGNVVGFIIALQHIDTGSLGSAEGVQKVAASLLAGMGVAFCSTLVGAVAALWISVNGWVVGAGK